MLRERQGSFEDVALEAMMEAEELQERVAALERARTSIDEVITGLRREIAEAEAEIDAQLADVAAKRVEVAAAVAPELVAEYERR